VRLACVALTGCISVDVDLPGLPACAAQQPSEPATRALAIVGLELAAPPYELCNAVAIAPTLLLTAVNCVTPLLSKDVDAGYVPPRCTSTGAAIEDGQFLFRYAAEAAQPGAIDLVREDGTPLEAGVSAIFVSAAASTCTSDVAIVETQLALDVNPIPIRLEPAEQGGDEVVVIGYDLRDGALERRLSTATIVEATDDRGSPTLPPRSMALSGDTCAKPGGAVIAADTGALVGFIQTTDRTINCDSATGSPVAARVAPYRQFILEVARDTQTSLVAEVGSDRSGLVLPCDGM
jgi:hypothetical protein